MEEKQGRRREGRRTGWEEGIMDGKKVKKVRRWKWEVKRMRMKDKVD